MGIDHSNPYIHSTTVLCDTWKHMCIAHQQTKVNKFVCIFFETTLLQRYIASCIACSRPFWKPCMRIISISIACAFSRIRARMATRVLHFSAFITYIYMYILGVGNLADPYLHVYIHPEEVGHDFISRDAKRTLCCTRPLGCVLI